MEVINCVIRGEVKECTCYPLRPIETQDCGKLDSKKIVSGVTITKYPDKRCKLRSISKK